MLYICAFLLCSMLYGTMPGHAIKLSGFEKVSAVYNQYLPFNVIRTVKFQGSINVEHLTQALQIAQGRHPKLRARIAQESGEAYFITQGVGGIPVRVVYDRSVQELVHEELSTYFDLENGPLMRIALLPEKKGGALVISVHHIITDGVSIAFFIDELFELIDQINRGDILSDYQDKGFTYSCADMLHPQEEQALFYGVEASDEREAQSSITCLNGITTGYITATLPAEKTNQIKRSYRSLGSSLQAHLTACMAQVIAERVSKKNGGQPCNILTHHPVNLRNFFDPELSARDFGCLIGCVSFPITCDRGATINELSLAVKQDLYHRIAQEEHLLPLAACQKLTAEDLTVEHVQKATQIHGPAIAVSQVGTVPYSAEHGHLRISAIHSLLNWHGMFCHEDNFMVSGLIFDGKLFLTFMYPSPIVSDEDAQQMANKVVEYLIT